MPAGMEKSKKASESIEKGSRDPLMDSGNPFCFFFLHILGQKGQRGKESSSDHGK